MYRYTKAEIPHAEIPQTDSSQAALAEPAKRRKGSAAAAVSERGNTPAATTLPDAELVEALIAQDVNRTDAERLARTLPEECARQLEYLPYVTEFRSGKGAYLRSAIEGGYGAPRNYREAQQQSQKTQKRARIQQSRTEAARQKEAQIEAARAAAQADAAAWEQVVQAAQERMPRIIRERPQHPTYAPTLRACIDAVVAERTGLPHPGGEGSCVGQGGDTDDGGSSKAHSSAAQEAHAMRTPGAPAGPQARPGTADQER
jgi:hypothetical protein